MARKLEQYEKNFYDSPSLSAGDALFKLKTLCTFENWTLYLDSIDKDGFPIFKIREFPTFRAKFYTKEGHA